MSVEKPSSIEKPTSSKTAPEQVSDTPKALALIQNEPSLQSQLRDITDLLADPQYSQVVKTELRLQLNASKGKIAGLMKMEDIASIGELLGNMMSNIKGREEKITKDTTNTKADKRKEQIENKNAKIEIANKRIEAMFDAFGWEKKFQDTFPEHQKWEDQAQQKALQRDPLLKDKPAELDAQVKLQVFLDNRQEIEKKAPQGTDLSKIYRELEHSANDLNIPYSVPSIQSVPSLPPANEEKAKASFSEDEQKHMVRQGDELRSASPDGMVKVMDMKTGEMYVEGANGVRIPSKQEYHNSYEIEANTQVLTEELNGINATLSGLHHQLNAISEKLWIPKTDALKADSFASVKQNLDQRMKNADPNTPDYKDAEKVLAEVNKIEEEFKEKQKRKEFIEWSLLPAYEQAKKVHARQYQESVQTETEASKNNLQFLSSTHLDSFLKDDGIRLLIDEINEHKTSIASSGELTHLTLENKWGTEEKRLFAEGIKKLLGLQAEEVGQFFKPDGYTMKDYSPDGEPMEKILKDRLEKNDVYGGNPPAVMPEGIKRVMNRERQ